MNLFQSTRKSIKTKGFFKKYATVYLIILFLIISFWGGLTIGQNSDWQQGNVLNEKEKPPAFLAKDIDFDLFWQVWQLINEKYVDRPVAGTKLLYGALAGLVAGVGDPYSVFLDPKITEEFADELAGSYEGVGAEIGLKKGRLTIIAPLPDSPAQKAGLKSGDKIYAIDGYETTEMSVEQAIKLIKGRKGTEVVLTIGREGEKELREIKIKRAAIRVKSVKLEFKDNLALLVISSFSDDTQVEFEKAVKQILVNNPQGVILDLRNNPGGYLDVAVEAAGEWLPGQVIVKEGLNSEQAKDYYADGQARLAGFKTVVLVNLGSASAAEIMAGALQDYNQATIVGEKTFGKGSVQDLISLPDGSSLKITTARWFTPKGRTIDQQGIKPDLEIELTQDDYDNNRDPQLDRAVELLSP